MSNTLPALSGLDPNALTVAHAMALLWTPQSRGTVGGVIRAMGAKSSSGSDFLLEEVKDAMRALRERGLLVEQAGRQDHARLIDPARALLYRQLLEDTPRERLHVALRQAFGYRPDMFGQRWPLWDTGATVSLLRLELLTGAPAEELKRLSQAISRSFDWDKVLDQACFEAFDGPTFERIDEDWRWSLASKGVAEFSGAWQLDRLPLLNWAIAQAEAGRAISIELRYALAEAMLHRGEVCRMNELLGKDTTGFADALRAATLVQAGRWPEAQEAFEAAIRKRQAEAGARKRVLPARLAGYYSLALLARNTAAHLELARKFCLGESGSRTPIIYGGWGLWVHAIGARLGDVALNHDILRLSPPGRPTFDDLWRMLLRAWLGAQTVGAEEPAVVRVRGEAIEALRQRLRTCGLAWLEAQVAAAETVYSGGPAPGGFFVAGAQESWRNVLASLTALGGEAAAEGAASRLLWSVRLDEAGSVEVILPLEQKRGPRGWGKPRAIPLSRLAGNERLEPWDARVARAIRKDPYGRTRAGLDRAMAIVALIGHPAVVLADAPENPVDVLEGVPEMEVVREGDRFVLHVSPRPRPAEGDDRYLDTEERKEREALRQITVLRDSPQRIRVVRFTPAQRRAAQLLSERFSVPADAQDELQSALQALSGHFHILSDHARAAREVEAEARLRAELAPAGEGLMLRLVAVPLGADGPRLAPGVGRERVMAAVRGETVGAQRALAAERAHLDAVLEALPFLDPPDAHDPLCEWVVDDPEQALAMVETLPALPGVAAVDWPRGQPVRVHPVRTEGIKLRVDSGRDWFRVDGKVQLDEGLVLTMETLLAWAGKGGGRFVPMGEGVYAALTRDLRERLADLAQVATLGKDGARVPALAAAWLDELLEGVPFESDKAFRERIERLRAAQDIQPVLPKGLQAELRPYQEEGYAWIMRLAAAGFGACLADDMGLGKTIQSLAVLLARGPAGPALVVAPTSVCGNWLAEMQRFAPALNPLPYGEGDRTTTLEQAGPMDVVIVSYTLMQQAKETFAARTWHTLVADEAQAVKNAATKRSQALFELLADLRLALSGTPVENRLAELWSIMRFCNPGLLGPLSRFNERFAAPIERERNREALRLLRRLIAPFVLRRTKAQVLRELPPRTELILSVAPEAEEAAHYEALRRQAVAEAETATADAQAGQARMHVLAQLTRLRRAACDPRLVSPNLGLIGAKVRAFAELAVELADNGHKALVFSQFVDFLSLLRVPLDEAGIRYQYLDGSTPAAERTRRVAAFQAGEGDMFLISLKAGGYGLNLTAADYVVITDPWWNPAAEDQAMGRAHRIGQQRPVTVYRLVGKGTVEESIVALHDDKRALADGVLAEGEGAALPSTDELIALLRL